MIIDTHAHLNFNAYKDDADEVIRRSFDNDIQMINVGSQYSTSKRAVEMAEKYSGSLPADRQGVYAAIGLHPIHVQDGFNCEEYKKLVNSKKVVAIGEIGLDYKLEYFPFKEKQKEVFLQQLDLAQELKLPVIIHCRLAHNDLIEMLQKYNAKLRGVVHCFTGNWADAQEYMKMGFYLGFNGIIFKTDLDEVIEKTPIEKMFVETDCPYLIPPQVGGQRNEPICLKYIIEKISKIKKISIETVEDITTDNARNLFKI